MKDTYLHAERERERDRRGREGAVCPHSQLGLRILFKQPPGGVGTMAFTVPSHFPSLFIPTCCASCRIHDGDRKHSFFLILRCSWPVAVGQWECRLTAGELLAGLAVVALADHGY